MGIKLMCKKHCCPTVEILDDNYNLKIIDDNGQEAIVSFEFFKDYYCQFGGSDREPKIPITIIGDHCDSVTMNFKQLEYLYIHVQAIKLGIIKEEKCSTDCQCK